MQILNTNTITSFLFSGDSGALGRTVGNWQLSMNPRVGSLLISAFLATCLSGTLDKTLKPEPLMY